MLSKITNFWSSIRSSEPKVKIIPDRPIQFIGPASIHEEVVSWLLSSGIPAIPKYAKTGFVVNEETNVPAQVWEFHRIPDAVLFKTHWGNQVRKL